MDVRIERITPERALEYLARSKNFRPWTASRSQQMADAVKRGEWDLNGETIKFNCDGSLLDGQHRLHAVIISGIAVDFVVVRGVTSDLNVDCGRNRSYADILHSRGEEEFLVLSGATRLAFLWDRGLLRSYGKIPTNAELDATLAKYPRLRDSAKWIKKLKSVTAKSLFAFLHFAFSTKDAAAATEFMVRLDDGAGLDPDNPILRLRDRIAQNRASKAKLTTTELTALVIIAWNFWRAGRQVKFLRWMASGQNPQPFPEIE